MQIKNRSHKIRVIFFLAFIFSLSIALPTYVNSTFLAEFIPEHLVGAVFTVGSAVGILGFVFIPLLLRKLGNFKTSVLLISLIVLILTGIAINPHPIFTVLLFLIYLPLYRIIAYNNDLFLEHFSTDKTTGTIRGLFLTISNMAWVLAPIAAGFILGGDNYWRLYAIAAVLSTILIPILIHDFRKYEDPPYDKTSFWKTLRSIKQRKDVYRVFMVQLTLRFFYSWMVIYAPLYLHSHVGLPWSTIGIIFTIMLLPFSLFEYPLGRLADTKYGEKEIMTIGFFILAGATMYISFIQGATPWVWALALFGTRVGASMVDISSETYFFKKVTDADSNLLSFFRTVGPLAYLIGPVVASLLLLFVDIQYLFLILGILMLWGLRYSLTLHDTL